MNNKKIILVFIFLSVTVILTLVLLFRESNDVIFNENESNNITNDATYMIIDNEIWQYNQNWTKTKVYNSNNMYNIYVNNNYLGDYYLEWANVWNILDQNKNKITYNGDLLAFDKTLNVKVKNPYIENISTNDINEINDILKLNIKLNELIINEKITIDLDNNGILDKIVNISNVDEEITSDYYNLLYIVINGQRIVLKNDHIEASDVLITPLYNLKNILNINNELFSSIILKESNSQMSSYLMYQYIDGTYQKVI